MTEGSSVVQSACRTRRVIGLGILVLGAIVTARDAWLGFFYGSGFSGEERIRFVFLLWLGGALILAGCWLGFRLRAAAWALLIVAASLPLLAYSYGRWWS